MINKAVTMLCEVLWIETQHTVFWKGANIPPQVGISQTVPGYTVDQGIYDEKLKKQVSTLTISSAEIRKCGEIVDISCSVEINGKTFQDEVTINIKYPSKMRLLS